jgi:hypothetical protein
VLVASADGDLDATARRLRSGLAAEIGLEQIDAVYVLGPRELGIDADAFPREIAETLDAQRATLQQDDIQGVINIAERLQFLDEVAALPGEPIERLDEGFPTWAIILLVLAGVAGIVAFVFARRAATRGSARAAATQREVAAALADALAVRVDGGAAGAAGALRDAREAIAAAPDEEAMRTVGPAIVAALATARPPGAGGLLDGICAFDPGHGTATQERAAVDGPDAGTAVPVCDACAARLDGGGPPVARTVPRGDGEVGYWRAMPSRWGAEPLFGDPGVASALDAAARGS